MGKKRRNRGPLEDSLGEHVVLPPSPWEARVAIAREWAALSVEQVRRVVARRKTELYRAEVASHERVLDLGGLPTSRELYSDSEEETHASERMDDRSTGTQSSHTDGEQKDIGEGDVEMEDRVNWRIDNTGFRTSTAGPVDVRI